MALHTYFFLLNTLQTGLGIAVILLVIRAHVVETYWPLVFMAVWQAPSFFVLLYIRSRGPHRLPPLEAYHLYFTAFWLPFALSALCSLIFTYILFRNAMRPLKGLQSLGNIVFGWAAVITLLTTFSVVTAPTSPGTDHLILALTQFDRASALMTISLFTFVVMSIRPMGLSVRSRVFGSSLGTLVVAITNTAQSTYMTQPRDLYNVYSLVQLSSSCIALGIWIYYFARPEPERNFILLPTTSPFHYWNDIALRLDQEPGVVAIGGFNPNAFAGAEVEVFRRASAKMPAPESSGEQQPRT